MSFTDVLRQARDSRVAVIHEFWTQYDPKQRRLHAFFEAQDDILLISPTIDTRLPQGYKLFTYRCDGKERVFEAFSAITARIPDVKLTLFFVDKDIDDILGRDWPTDPRIFVTDVYSIENYCATPIVLSRFYAASVKLRDVTFNEGVIAAQFTEQQARFRACVLPLMAWILVARRMGFRPNLNNLRLSDLISFTADGRIRSKANRLESLGSSTGVTLPARSGLRIRHAIEELQRLQPQRVIRGKFEAWFVVRFWLHLMDNVKQLAAEANGKASFLMTLSDGTCVSVLARHLDVPPSLDLFLRAHIAAIDLVSSDPTPQLSALQSIAQAVLRLLSWR
jgi:hypothetical protein